MRNTLNKHSIINSMALATQTAHRTPLAQSDPQVYELIKREEARQEHNLELIASENIASLAVRE